MGTEEHKDLMSLPDFGKTKQNKAADMICHKGRYSLPRMLSGTPSTQDEGREIEEGVRVGVGIWPCNQLSLKIYRKERS